jgi:polysaccharide export outer membrane protein
MVRVAFGVAMLAFAVAAGAAAQTPAAAGSAAAQTEGVRPPSDYVIGPADKLSVRFWDDAKMSAEVVVRPDGMITLPLLNDLQAAGLTPEQLRETVLKGAAKYVEGANVQIIVVEINSRRVYITGMVANAGPYPLVGPTTVLQLIATAGGLQEFAKGKDIRILRRENGREVAHRFNYNDVRQGKNLAQNIELKPGDTVIVP